MKPEDVIGIASGVFVAAVLLSILANPRSKHPLDWLWPPVFYERAKEIMTRANYVSTRSVNPVLGRAMG
jgi:hypothetical protein